MTSLLLIISFLLHTIILIGLFQLLKQIQSLKHSKDKETETMMLAFIDEIKTENQRLQQQLNQHQGKTSDDPLLYEQKEATSERPDLHDESKVLDERNSQLTDRLQDQQEEMKLSLEGRVLQLNQKGYSIEEIAEILTCGKTEVELILNLQQQLKQNT